MREVAKYLFSASWRRLSSAAYSACAVNIEKFIITNRDFERFYIGGQVVSGLQAVRFLSSPAWVVDRRVIIPVAKGGIKG